MKNRIVFFDLETGGLQPGIESRFLHPATELHDGFSLQGWLETLEDRHPIKRLINGHPVIQFGGVAVEDWETVEEFEVKLHFDLAAAEPEALAGNSFDPEVWATKAVTSHDAVWKIGDFLRRHATVPVPKKSGDGTWMACQLAGHNAASFDRAFLGKLFDVHGEFCVGTLQVLDTLKLAEWWRETLPADRRPENLRLPTLCAHFGIELAEAHDALADARASAALAHRLMAGSWPLPPTEKGEQS